jgi:hypothetical protein
MRKTLIALAAAGVLASGVAVAGNTSGHGFGATAFVPVQYTQRHDDRWDNNRWYDRSDNINEREARIRARIQRGQNDGRITDREARFLYRQLATIEAKERTFKADGRLSYREEAELKRNLDTLAQNTRLQARDEDRRYSYNR